MDAMAIGLLSFVLGTTRRYGRRASLFKMGLKDKYLFFIACFVLIASFTLIALGRNTAECFGLIGIVIGHFFGRELGKNE